VPRPISGSSAACILELWLAGKFPLTEDQFEEYQDTVIRLLEECNDDKYKFAPDQKETP